MLHNGHVHHGNISSQFQVDAGDSIESFGYWKQVPAHSGLVFSREHLILHLDSEVHPDSIPGYNLARRTYEPDPHEL